LKQKNCKKTRFWELLLPKSRLFTQQLPAFAVIINKKKNLTNLMICFESDALSLEVLLQLRRHVATGRLKLLLELSQTESKKIQNT
jgi:hypothetical protein